MMFKSSVRKYGDKVFIKNKMANNYVGISWLECDEIIKYFSLYLISIGVKKEDRIVLLSENRPEWIFSDLAITSIGAINVTTFLPCGSLRIKYILKDCNPKVVIVQNLRLLKDIPIDYNIIKKIIIFESVDNKSTIPHIDFQKCLIKGKKLYSPRSASLLTLRIQSIQEDDIATVIYNINATTEFKGVMLTHKNLIYNCKAFAKMVHVSKNDVSFHFNPFSQVFGRLCGYYLTLHRGAIMALGDFHRKIISFEDNEITIVFASPIVFYMMYKTILKRLRRIPYFKRKITLWTINIQRKYIQNVSEHRTRPIFFYLKFLVARSLTLLFLSKKIRKYIIKNKVRLFISGGAHLNQKIPRLFYSMGLPLLDAYGLTECLVVSINTKKWKIGTVGRALPNVEIKIEKDGEIMIRGPNVMRGYYNDQAKTEEIMTDKWFHTGDIGFLDKEHFLNILELKKNIIITANGLNINPDIIKEMLKKDKYIDDVEIFGDRKPYLVALIVPNLNLLQNYMLSKETLLLTNNVSLLTNPELKQFLTLRIEEILLELSKFEQIRKFVILNESFHCNLKTVDNIAKKRRYAIYNKYKRLINKMYNEVV